jgi:hypothetical protein
MADITPSKQTNKAEKDTIGLEKVNEDQQAWTNSYGRPLHCYRKKN